LLRNLPTLIHTPGAQSDDMSPDHLVADMQRAFVQALGMGPIPWDAIDSMTAES
jgi:hypothetical protein